MTEHCPVSGARQPSAQRSRRFWRPWLWSVSSWLRIGATAAAYCLALRAGILGALVTAAFVGGFFLDQILEATSQGD